MNKIWVLDDDLSILEVIKIVLEDEGYKVLAMSDGKNFNKKLKKELPDLILLDIWMPGMDGNEIVKRLKKQESTKNINVVIISALTDARKIAKEAGADNFLRKPFEICELLNVVKRYTNKNIFE
ncbi:response regulator [Candidatus Microgenomates bacterium]|nr:MAG: response regulator [Candidatus Microgenomates bacterium]